MRPTRSGLAPGSAAGRTLEPAGPSPGLEAGRGLNRPRRCVCSRHLTETLPPSQDGPDPSSSLIFLPTDIVLRAHFVCHTGVWGWGRRGAKTHLHRTKPGPLSSLDSSKTPAS